MNGDMCSKCNDKFNICLHITDIHLFRCIMIESITASLICVHIFMLISVRTKHWSNHDKIHKHMTSIKRQVLTERDAEDDDTRWSSSVDYNKIENKMKHKQIRLELIKLLQNLIERRIRKEQL